jgi:predicted DNA-binding transcriptional regulator AlpA
MQRKCDNAMRRGDGRVNKVDGDVARSKASPDQPRQRNRREVPDVLRENAFVDAGQFAEVIGISKRQLFRWMELGHIPDYDLKIGQTCRWKISTVRKWQEQNHQRAA